MLIETDCLLVRRLTMEDAEALFLVLSDPAVMKFIEPPFSVAQVLAFIQESGCGESPLVYAIVWKSTDEVIGHLIWHLYDENSVELGWILRKDLWGNGIATELTAALLTHIDRNIVIECSREQYATRHIAEKLGFRPISEDNGMCVFLKKQNCP